MKVFSKIGSFRIALGRFIKVSVTPIGLTCIILLGGCHSGSNSPDIFLHRIIDAHPNTGKDCCTDILMLGDINGDGNQDIVIGSEHAEEKGLVWYQYPTWEKHPVADGEFTTDGKTADIDGDGDFDIVIGAYASGNGDILWFENTSETGQGEWVRHEIGKGYAHDLIAGDLDGDGDLDIATCDKKKVVVWEHESDEIWREHIILDRKGEGIELADIDGDSDLDIVYGGSWLENPGTLKTGPWRINSIAPEWSPDTRVVVADMDRDGRPDVVLSVSEGKGALSWFQSPENPRTGTWIEHSIENGILEGAHSLQVADLDNDGDLDVVTAEMHTSPKKRILVYFNEGGLFKPLVLARTGSHNMKVSDIDNDGDYDIVGKNYGGRQRDIEMWENQVGNAKKFKYICIDKKRPKDQFGKMGLVFTDVNHDGWQDIVAGSFLYINPDGKLDAVWKRIELPRSVDIYFAENIDDDGLADLVGISGSEILWIEAVDAAGTAWNSKVIGSVPEGRTQGYTTAQLVPGGKPELVFTHGKNLFYLKIPEKAQNSDQWETVLISDKTEEEGVAAGDIDNDGDLDLATISSDGHHIIWLENNGANTPGPWELHRISDSDQWSDRIAVADVNRDGRLDVISTEETQDWQYNANIYWFEAPTDPKQLWKKYIVGTLRSVNSMDTADLDGDGDIDVVVAEHTDQRSEEGAPDNLTIIYENRDGGKLWAPRLVERDGHSSHLGSKLCDLDNDGNLDIVSIAWRQYRFLHVWENVAGKMVFAKP